MHISVFCGASLPHSEQITEAARQLGRAIARGGHTLLYGGSNLGLMGATSGAALQEGGRVVGVIPTSPPAARPYRKAAAWWASSPPSSATTSSTRSPSATMTE